MDIAAFRRHFWHVFNGPKRNAPVDALLDHKAHLSLDLCPDMPGMLSIRKQRLLNLSFSLIPEGQAYFEVGTYMGKSLISAMIHNPVRTVYAAGNFSEFDDNSLETLQENLSRYGMLHRVQFLNADFQKSYTPEFLREPIGLYFYDGAHDLESQYLGIKRVEPYLADEALIFVDDWRHGPDSLSHAKSGTLQAMPESTHQWKLLYELPARYNGDLGMWWNGVGVLSFQREAPMQVAI
ncbi:MAG: class I SAM-dependent methyltransferase [Candidatus Hydrogenedentes bacterium]|nr:class I SAM-dependent methyltransferase [Candidatus Hydrogenedentota bacterium]